MNDDERRILNRKRVKVGDIVMLVQDDFDIYVEICEDERGVYLIDLLWFDKKTSKFSPKRIYKLNNICNRMRLTIRVLLTNKIVRVWKKDDLAIVNYFISTLDDHYLVDYDAI